MTSFITPEELEDIKKRFPPGYLDQFPYKFEDMGVLHVYVKYKNKKDLIWVERDKLDGRLSVCSYYHAGWRTCYSLDEADILAKEILEDLAPEFIEDLVFFERIK